MELTLRQKQIIIGNVLGDGGIYTRNSPNSYFYIKQSEKYYEYLFWLFEELKNICPSKPKQRKDNKQWYFYTIPSKELTDIRLLFYRNNKKVIPANIQNLLTSSLTLAVWFMDDGTLDYRIKSHCAFHLCVNCFSKEEAQKLVNVLYKNFEIIASVYYTLCRGKRYAGIYIGAKGRDRFIELISPYILNCFKYKLPQYRRNPQRLGFF